MNRLTIFYWTLTGLMAAFMGLGASLDLLSTPDAKALMTHLGYPLYLMPYLGVVAVVLPVVPARSKEWAYAGLLFDVLGAFYSAIAVGDGPAGWVPAFLGIVLIAGSYSLYTHRLTTSKPDAIPGNIA